MHDKDREDYRKPRYRFNLSLRENNPVHMSAYRIMASKGKSVSDFVAEAVIAWEGVVSQKNMPESKGMNATIIAQLTSALNALGVGDITNTSENVPQIVIPPNPSEPQKSEPSEVPSLNVEDANVSDASLLPITEDAGSIKAAVGFLDAFKNK